ncbi:MAG: hypothetical protein R2749_26430 [Acidimicrobiales bacterium]
MAVHVALTVAVAASSSMRRRLSMPDQPTIERAWSRTNSCAARCGLVRTSLLTTGGREAAWFGSTGATCERENT